MNYEPLMQLIRFTLTRKNYSVHLVLAPPSAQSKTPCVNVRHSCRHAWAGARCPLLFTAEQHAQGGGGAVHVGSRRRAARLDAKIIVLGPACEVTSRAVALHCTATSSYNASHVLDTEANVSGALFWAR